MAIQAPANLVHCHSVQDNAEQKVVMIAICFSLFLAGRNGIIIKGNLGFALFVGNDLGRRLIYTLHIGLNLNKHTDEDLAKYNQLCVG
jgi:hypothetical protein